MVAAIDVYNKPDFSYREETFSILALNAWELLLKARYLAHHSNDLRCLYVYEQRQTKGGTLSKRAYLRRNRAGNPHTLGMGRVLGLLEGGAGIAVPPAVRANLDALTEIRDNAVHLLNPSPRLVRAVLKIGTAAVRNFVELARAWFGLDLSKYSLYLMPIAFLPPPTAATGITVSADEAGLLDYLTRTVKETAPDSAGLFHVSLEVELVLKRSSVSGVGAVSITTDPSAPEVVLSEENIRKNHPWDYRALTDILRHRYIDFKENRRYHELRKPLMKDERFVRARYLDPGNPKSAKKDFYSSNILQELDKHYTRSASGNGS